MDIAKSSLKILSAKVGKAVTNFLGIVVFSHILGASVLGTYFLFVAVLGIASILADFGLKGAVEKRISEGENSGSFVIAAFLAKFPPVIFVSLLIYGLNSYLNNYLGEKLAFALIAVLVSKEVAEMPLFILRGKLRVGETAALKLTFEFIWISTSISLFTLGLGIYGLIYGHLLGFIIMGLFGWYKVSLNASRPSLYHIRSLFDYGRYNIISTIGGYFYNWMDIVIIGFFLSQKYVGAYEVAWRVTMLGMLLSQAIATAIFPQVSRWNASNAVDQVESLIPSAVSPSLFLAIPLFFGTLVLSNDILRIIFGKEFTIAALVMIVLMSEKILQSIHVVLARSLQAIDRPDLAAVATMIAVVINLVLNFILVWKFGIVGAAMATTISFAVNTTLHWKFLSEFINIELSYLEIVWSVVSSTTMAICVILVYQYFGQVDLFELVALITFGALVYCSMMAIHRPIRGKTIQQIRSMY